MNADDLLYIRQVKLLKKSYQWRIKREIMQRKEWWDMWRNILVNKMSEDAK